ncbi:helix-turn-helix domain-containing protein [Microbacterium karelineae]|uniref:helix-turn-helix domain-containing protein n=1 Tax=Microbacterium karelineae TaxID=2654283 RepID=UPI0012EA35F6|nr:XRE family transcriptional regulator [Microbacterium karelineae]
MAIDDDGVAAALGRRLRTIRTQRGLTLAELQRDTGISMSTLSRLEGGGRRATVELLLPLARAYGVTLDELVGAPETGDPRVHIKPIVRGGITYIPLTRRAGALQAFKVIYPGERTDHGGPDAVLARHDGYEWMYVLSGRLRLRLGEQTILMGPGEAAEFDTHVPHSMGSADGRSVEVLSLFGAQGERAHLRASSA